jgi:hypothetical protein
MQGHAAAAVSPREPPPSPSSGAGGGGGAGGAGAELRALRRALRRQCRLGIPSQHRGQGWYVASGAREKRLAEEEGGGAPRRSEFREKLAEAWAEVTWYGAGGAARCATISAPGATRGDRLGFDLCVLLILTPPGPHHLSSHAGCAARSERGRWVARCARGESKRLVIEPPCPPCTSHGASIRQPFGAGTRSCPLRTGARCVPSLRALPCATANTRGGGSPIPQLWPALRPRHMSCIRCCCASLQGGYAVGLQRGQLPVAAGGASSSPPSSPSDSCGLELAILPAEDFDNPLSRAVSASSATNPTPLCSRAPPPGRDDGPAPAGLAWLATHTGGSMAALLGRRARHAPPAVHGVELHGASMKRLTLVAGWRTAVRVRACGAAGRWRRHRRRVRP